MIDAKTWAFANAVIPGAIETPKDKQARLVKSEIDNYFANGGILTRREKTGALSFWAGPRDGELKRITLQQRNALVKAQQEG